MLPIPATLGFRHRDDLDREKAPLSHPLAGRELEVHSAASGSAASVEPARAFPNDRHVHFAADNTRWQVAAQWVAALVGWRSLRWSAWQTQRRALVVKRGPHRTVTCTQWNGGNVYVKHFHSPH